MILKAHQKIKKFLNRENRPPLFTLRIYKRHIVLFCILIFLGLSAYGAYFRFFMVLPQSSASIMPKFGLSLADQKILVLAPHCDDETLGAGGLIQQAKNQNSQIRVAIVTDCNKSKIGTTRKSESTTALNELGVESQNIIFWNFLEKETAKTSNPDGLSLSQAIDREIADYQPTLIVSPHPDDTHIDHKSTAEAVRKLVQQKYGNIKIAYYLIHYNFLQYPNPSGLHPNDYLLPPARLISFNQQWYVLDLSAGEEDIKQEAILKYKSQLSLKNPILHEILLDFVRKNELFMVEN